MSNLPKSAKGISDFKATPTRGEATEARRRRPIPQGRIKIFTRSREPEGDGRAGSSSTAPQEGPRHPRMPRHQAFARSRPATTPPRSWPERRR
jgi:hypothetical protein